MARPTPTEWIAKNPIRKGETADQYRQRYKDDTEPTLLESGLSAAGDFGRSAIAGGFSGIGSTVRGIGELTGSRTLRSGGRDMQTLADEYRKATVEDPEGFVSGAGQLAGRGAYEIASALSGAGLVTGGLNLLGKTAAIARNAPKLAAGARAVASGLEKGGIARRALTSAGINAPFDIVQGAGEESGILLPGKTGAIAENVFFSGAGGLLEGGLAARRAARAEALRAGEEAAAQVGPFRASPLPDSYDYGPYQASGLPDSYDYGPYQASPLPDRGRRSARTREEYRASRPQFEQEMPKGATAKEVAQYLQDRNARRGAKARMERLRAQIEAAGEERTTVLERAAERIRQKQDAQKLGFADFPENIRAMQTGKMPLADQQAFLAINDPLISESEMLAEAAANIGRGRTRLGPLTQEELAAMTPPRPPMMQAARTRRGAVSAELLSMLSGGGAGALYGGTEGDTPEQRLANALAYGAAGAGLGFGGARFFKGGGTGATADAVNVADDMARRIRQKPVSPPKTGTPMADFPDNREPLFRRSRVSDFGPAEEMLFQNRVREIEPTIKRPMTEANVRAESEKITGSKTLSQMLALNPERITPAESLALLTLHRDLRKQVAQRVDLLNKATDPDDITALGDDIEALDNMSAKFLAKIMAGDTAAGRALATRQYMAQEITDPTYWYIKANRMNNGRLLSDAEKLQIDKLTREADPKKLLQYLASIQKSSKAEQVASLRASGLLTAIPGRLRDAISTSTNYISTVVQRYPGALADAIAAKAVANRLGGTADQYRTMLAPTIDEFSNALGGAKEGLVSAAESMGFNAARKGGLDAWVNAIRQAEIDPDMARRLEIPSLTNIDLFSGRIGEKANVFLDTYSKAVMRSAGVTDKIINAAAMKGALNEQARLIAKRTGKSVDELLARPTDEMLLNAKQAADYITFTNDGTIANGIAGAIERFAAAAEAGKRGNGALVRAGARFIMPFRRTPANILSRALEYSPGVGTIMAGKAARDWTKELAVAALRQNGPELARSQRRMIEMLTKQAAGASMFALGAMLYNKGRITGEFPESPAEREQWALEGKKPESILINGEWMPISRISPYGGMMTLAASVLNNAEKIDQSASVGQRIYEGLTEGAESTLGSVLNQPMVTGPQEALAALTGRSQRGGNNPLADFAGSMAGSFVPTAIAQAARAEGIQRRPENLLQEIASRVPGLQEMAPARLNILGEPVRSGGGVLNTMLNPLTSTEDVRETDPLVKELSRVGVNISAMSRGKGETTEMYNYRQREAGRVIRQDLTELVQSNDYNMATPEERKRLILDTVRSVRRELSDYLKSEYNISPSGDEP